MKKIINSQVYGEIHYEESFWTGKKEININGKNLIKLDKKTYYFEEKEGYSFNEETKKVFVTTNGGYFQGGTLQIGDEILEVIPKTLWWEWVLAFLPFLFDCIWGNSVKLCKIFPLIGGLIGGVICGVMGCIILYVMKKYENKTYKLLLGLCGFIITLMLLYLGAIIFLKLAA